MEKMAFAMIRAVEKQQASLLESPINKTWRIKQICALETAKAAIYKWFDTAPDNKLEGLRVIRDADLIVNDVVRVRRRLESATE